MWTPKSLHLIRRPHSPRPSPDRLAQRLQNEWASFASKRRRLTVCAGKIVSTPAANSFICDLSDARSVAGGSKNFRKCLWKNIGTPPDLSLAVQHGPKCADIQPKAGAWKAFRALRRPGAWATTTSPCTLGPPLG